MVPALVAWPSMPPTSTADRADHAWDAVVVGSGPNGLVAAITLAQAGWRVLVVEAADHPGGGLRSAELIEGDVVHDLCSAIHPLGIASPALRALPLAEHGLDWIHPGAPLAHTLDDRSVLLHRDVAATAAGLDADGDAYRRLMGPLVRAGLGLTDSLLSPFDLPPPHPVALARFGANGIRPATKVAARFGDGLGGLFAGLAAHSTLPLTTSSTGAYGMLLGLLGHLVGWPLARGGSRSIARALVGVLRDHGGEVHTGWTVADLDELPPSRAVLLDLTPRQVVDIAGHRLPSGYRTKLGRYRYGPGVFKVDWVLDGPTPWADPATGSAATVHLGGSLAEVTAAEATVHAGGHPQRPFVLFAQPTIFDPTRAPAGIHTAWAYCHVPNGSTIDMTDRIERQVERFAPGFRDRIRGRHVMTTAALEHHDANYVGGDIGGGVADVRQLVARPTLGLHPWATPVDGLYLCSSSTPPGAGVHGMCGWHAAREALRRQPC